MLTYVVKQSPDIPGMQGSAEISGLFYFIMRQGRLAIVKRRNIRENEEMGPSEGASESGSAAVYISCRLSPAVPERSPVLSGPARPGTTMSPERVHVGVWPSMNAGLPFMAWKVPEKNAGDGPRDAQRAPAGRHFLRSAAGL